MEVAAGKWGRASNHLGLGNYLLVVLGQRIGGGDEVRHLLMQLLFILLFTWEINGFSHTAGPRLFIIGSGVSLRLALSRECVLPGDSRLLACVESTV